MTKKMVMMQGLPASGKSFWAKQFVKSNTGWFRICNDEIRLAFFGRAFAKQDTKHINAMRMEMVNYAISKSLNIIIDNCNLKHDHEAVYRAIAEKNGYEFSIKSFLDVPIGECIRRDRIRPNKVGHWVILGMYNQFIRKDDEPILEIKDVIIPEVRKDDPVIVWQNPALPKAIICDLDGTLALFERDPYDASTCDEDKVNEPVLAVVNAMRLQKYEILFVSGRKDIYREPTEKFLKNKCGFKGDFQDYRLFMRQPNDNRRDSIVKKEIFDAYINRQYFVQLVLDDRSQVVEECWRKMGLVCFQVAEGNF
jgi:predicted kinase